MPANEVRDRVSLVTLPWGVLGFLRGSVRVLGGGVLCSVRGAMGAWVAQTETSRPTPIWLKKIKHKKKAILDSWVEARPGTRAALGQFSS